MKDKEVLLVIVVVLAVFSLINFQFEIISNRILRLLTSGIFFFLAFKIFTIKKILGLAIFGLLTLCDFLLLEWEATFAKHAYYFLHSLIMLSLMGLTIIGMKWKSISYFEVISAILFLLVSAYIFLELGEYFTIDDTLLEILFTINGFFIVFLVVLAFFYSMNRPDEITLFFFLGILGLVVSDLLLFSTYFIDTKSFVSIDSFFYAIGLFFLLRVSLANELRKKSKIPLEKERRDEDNSDRNNLYK